VGRGELLGAAEPVGSAELVAMRVCSARVGQAVPADPTQPVGPEA